MIHGTGELDAQLARHVLTLPSTLRAVKSRWANWRLDPFHFHFHELRASEDIMNWQPLAFGSARIPAAMGKGTPGNPLEDRLVDL